MAPNAGFLLPRAAAIDWLVGKRIQVVGWRQADRHNREPLGLSRPEKGSLSEVSRSLPVLVNKELLSKV